MCCYRSDLVFIYVFIGIATRADVYELSFLKDFKAGKDLDVDFVGINCSIADPSHQKAFITIIGTKLSTHPAVQPVKDHGDDGKEWLQLAAYPWVIRMDMRGVPNEEIEQLKDRICMHLRDLGHSCIPSLNIEVSTCVVMCGYIG